MLKDQVNVADSGLLSLRHNSKLIDERVMRSELDKPVVEVKGWVNLIMRERGKIVPGSHRQGFNIWTNTGREYLALLMSIATAPSTSFRSDHVSYIGVGTGTQIEDTSVLSLAQGVPYIAGVYLAALDVPPTFPLTPTRTTVRFNRVFAENEVSIGGGNYDITELGLFTDGAPSSNYTPGTRDTTYTNWISQSPVAYKTFEPVRKTNALELAVSWEIRF